MLAVLDHVYGFAQRPLHFAAVAYVSFFGLLAWSVARGIHIRLSRPVRPTTYAAFVLLNVLTAAFILAWRVGSDALPYMVRRELQQGDALLAAGDRDGAHLVYREVYRRFPGAYPVLMRMGAVNYQVSDFERARKYYTRALETASPQSRWRALNDLGQTLWKLQRPAEAVELYMRARNEGLPDSESTEWHYRVAWAYFDLHDFQSAVEHYEEVAVRGDAYAAASRYNIACALAQEVKTSRSPAERDRLVAKAIDSLRGAWKATRDPEDARSLRVGLLGSASERDPELDPLRASPAWRGFLREIR